EVRVHRLIAVARGFALDVVQAEHDVDVGAPAARARGGERGADGMPEGDHVPRPRDDARLLEDLALDGLQERLVVLGIAPGELPRSACRLPAALHQERLALAQDDATAPDREVAEVDEATGAVRAREALPSTVVLGDQRLRAVR